MESQQIKIQAELTTETINVLRRSYKTNKELLELCQELYSARGLNGDKALRRLLLEAIDGCEKECCGDKDLGIKKKKELESLKELYKARMEKEHQEYKESVGW